MSLKLTTSLSQRLVLTPQLRQRIEMLQMTTLELTDLIQQQMLENPVLEEVASQEEAREMAEKILDHLAGADPASSFDQPSSPAENGLGTPSANGSGDQEGVVEAYADAEAIAATEAQDGSGAVEFSEEGPGDDLPGEDSTARDAFEEIDFGREFQDYLDPGYKTQEFEYKEDSPTFEQFLTKAPSLNEHLEWQLHMAAPEGEISKAAEAVIGNLDQDGRLNATNEEIAAQGGWSEETVERGRMTVMGLDPVGCGARNVRECLLAQIEARGETDRLAAQLIRDHLEE